MSTCDGASELDWAEATYLQACFDFFNGRQILLASDFQSARAVALAQFQQCAEKSMKAMVIVESLKKSGTRIEVIDKHTVFKDFIQGNKQLESVERCLKKHVHPWSTDEIIDLELMAPQGLNTSANTEYPWKENATIYVPADYFRKKPNEYDRVDKFKGIAEAVWLAATTYEKLRKVKVSAEQFNELK